MDLQGDRSAQRIAGRILLAARGSPEQIQLKLRMPLGRVLSHVIVNGRPVKGRGARSDTVVISTGQEKQFDIWAQYD